MNTIFGLLLVVAVGLFAQMPSSAHAQTCVANAFSGVTSTSHTQKPFILTTQQKDGSYSVHQTSVFRYLNSLQLRSFWTTGKNAGLFSNREDGNQPFDVTDSDERRVTISTNGNLWIENLDYGTSETLTNPACYGNAIVWSNSTRVYILTYGTASLFVD